MGVFARIISLLTMKRVYADVRAKTSREALLGNDGEWMFFVGIDETFRR